MKGLKDITAPEQGADIRSARPFFEALADRANATWEVKPYGVVHFSDGKIVIDLSGGQQTITCCVNGEPGTMKVVGTKPIATP